MHPIISEILYPEGLYKIKRIVLIVLAKEWNDTTAEEKEQLSKILAALKMNIASVQIIHRESISVDALATLNPSHVISFGVPFIPEIKRYENIAVEEIKVIQADALNELDDTKKRTLWLGLKSMFSF